MHSVVIDTFTSYKALPILLCSLIKMLYWMCERSGGLSLSATQLEHAIKRNFGGLESITFSPVKIFKTVIDFEDSRHWPDFSANSEDVSDITMRL